MTFLKIRNETLRTPTKPSRIVFVLVAVAAVISVGYIMALAILAPEQLAEATTAATDLVCDQCVGTTDIANGAVTSGKIANSQVKAADIATDAVNTAKILDGQVNGADIANEPFGVGTSDINNGAVRTEDIATGQVNTVDIANDAIKPNVQRVSGLTTEIAPGNIGNNSVDCPAGTILSGGGFFAGTDVRVLWNYPENPNTWFVRGENESAGDRGLTAYALCIGPSP